MGIADRWIMPGSTACVTRTVPSTLIVTMSSFSCSVVSAKYVGIVCDLPTLFTVIDVPLQLSEQGEEKHLPRTPTSKPPTTALSAAKPAGSFLAKSINWIWVSTLPPVLLATGGR